MKLVTSTEALKKALQSVQALLTEHQVILRADAGVGALIVEAGQNGVYLKQRVPAQILEQGEVVINSTYVTALQLSEKLELESKSGSALKFTSGSLSGTLEVHQSTQRIIDQRPFEDIEIKAQLSKDVITRAIAKANFNSALAQTQEGLRVKIDDHIAISTTDSFRASLFKDRLPANKANMDFMIKPTVLSLAVSKIEEQEVWLGLHKGTIKIASPSFEFYHPTIQTEPTDVESWLMSMDHNDKIGDITANVQDVLRTMNAVTSISGASASEVKLICTVKGTQLTVEVGAAHGSAKALLELTESTCGSHTATLHSKYTTEMLSLLKDGIVKISFYTDFIILNSGEGKCTSVVPTSN